MNAWLKATAAARRLVIRLARPLLRPIDRHLTAVLASAMAEPLGQLAAGTDALARRLEEGQRRYLQNAEEINLFSEAMVRELVRCQRQIDAVEQILDELRRRQAEPGFETASRPGGAADPLPPAEAA